LELELPVSLWPALHALTTPEPWPPESAGAERFVAEAVRQDLLPLLFAQDGLPAPVRAALEPHRMSWRLQAARTKLRIEAQRTLCAVLEGEPLLFLKGADFMHRLYPRPELRPMQDIDLLVPADRMGVVCKRLERHGLRPYFPGAPATRVATHHERAFYLDDVLVEVHQRFIQSPRHRIDYDGIWRRRVPLATAVPPAARLDDVDALAYQALTMAIDQFVVPLLRCVDFWLLARVAPGIVGAAAARAREWHIAHAFYGALRHTARAFPEFLAPEIEAAMDTVVTPREQRFIDRWVLPAGLARGRDTRRAMGLWRKFWLMDSADHRVAFLLSHARASVGGWLATRRGRAGS
jgi:hypothetical protein